MSKRGCRYEANFTKGSLLVVESRIVGGLLLQGASADAWQQAIAVENRLQKRAVSTATTQANLIRSRLKTIGPELWRLVSSGSKPVATHAVLAATAKFSPIFGDFLDLVVQEQIRQFKGRLRPVLWDAYLEACYDLCPGLAGWAQSTRSKLRQNALRMLAEAGYLTDTRTFTIALADDSLIVPLSTEIALIAADLTLSYKLAFADAVIYASARKHEVELVTSDDHFEGLPGVTYFLNKDAPR